KVKAVLTENVPRLRPGMTATVEIQTASRDNVIKAPIQAIVSRSAAKEKKSFERNSKRMNAGKGAVAAAEAQAEEDDDDTRDKRVSGVYVIRDGRAVFVPVKSGVGDDRFMEIQSGVAAGDKVITGPYQTLRTLESGKRVVEKKDLKKDAGKKDDTR